jgi:hypothetical protein
MVRKGHSVLEALRTGVELNTLKEFLNVDDLAVLRPVYHDGLLVDAAEDLALMRKLMQRSSDLGP